MAHSTVHTDDHELERRALAGNAFYVDSIERDIQHGRLVFHLTVQPDPYIGVIRSLIFTGVQNFEEYWDEDVDPECMESIMGLHQQRHEKGFRYIIRLEQSEMHFYSETEPRLEDVGAARD
jgi:hypothetical protein